jgi:biopolymer transport protein ExbD
MDQTVSIVQRLKDKRALFTGIATSVMMIIYLILLPILVHTAPAATAGTLIDEPLSAPNERIFRLDRRAQVAVYNYDGQTYINIRELINGQLKGLVLSVKQFRHLRRQLPSITKAVSELQAAAADVQPTKTPSS